MRIQHNIMAMNAYRNYNSNIGGLSSNLEKLSSGYRINRAGDDAAGLAISEKMRAQISGLDAAQKNVKDGISLVKTAEGALQEVQDMMNRMKYLATQSANGTYDNEVDRANLQKEVSALKDEINRIADSANFNGQKLLNGELAKTGTAGSTTEILADLSKMGIDLTANATDVNAVAGEYNTSALTGGNDVVMNELKDRFNVTVNFTDSDGNEQSVTVSLFTKAEGDNKLYLDDGSENGKELTAGCTTTDGTIDANEIGTAIAEALSMNDAIKANFSITDNGDDTLTFEAKTKGTGGAVLKSIEVSEFDYTNRDTAPDGTQAYGVTTHANKVDVSVEATDATKSYDFVTNGKLWDSSATKDTGNTVANLKDAIFEINGKKFAFVKNAPGKEDLAALKEAGVEHWVEVADGTSIAAADVETMIEKIEKETGLDVEQGTNTTGTWAASNTGNEIIFKASTSTIEGTDEGGMTLQIGDTAEKHNQLTVNIDDMHVDALGIGDLDIGSLEGAQDAVDAITVAINKVSSTRGDLGAIQNRLEHTTNNLSVMKENIQDAESTIRDTDVADEMMAYTKNNILIQSAQAMLAQANQVPQGVLQLLQ